jgi:hypothetical protein
LRLNASDISFGGGGLAVVWFGFCQAGQVEKIVRYSSWGRGGANAHGKRCEEREIQVSVCLAIRLAMMTMTF